MKFLLTIAATAALAFAGAAAAAGEHGTHGQEGASVGKPGKAAQASRTIEVDMFDNMRFKPETIEVKQGETIRFRVKNSGKQMHEMVLGTMKDLKEHADMMKAHPGMEHDEPYMTHVAPGKTETLLWHFTKAGEFHYGCLVPGHFEAGMLGKVKVSPQGESSQKQQ